MARLSDKPFVLLGVNSDQDRQALKKTLVDENITWRSWWDDGSVNGPIHVTWNVLQRPTIYVLDWDGLIRYKIVGEFRADELEKTIDDLLDELAAKAKG